MCMYMNIYIMNIYICIHIYTYIYVYYIYISGDNPSFRIYKRKKTHALLRPANVASPFLSIRGHDDLSKSTFAHRMAYLHHPQDYSLG